MRNGKRKRIDSNHDYVHAKDLILKDLKLLQCRRVAEKNFFETLCVLASLRENKKRILLNPFFLRYQES
jgi:hypothetical protein